MLRGELRKIEARKKEREKKTADLQKLIAQADTTSGLEVRQVFILFFIILIFPLLLFKVTIDQQYFNRPLFKNPTDTL